MTPLPCDSVSCPLSWHRSGHGVEPDSTCLDAEGGAPLILLMDHDRADRLAMGYALLARGWRVHCAASAEEAVRAMAARLPDLLIVEVSSGTVHGWDLLFHETLEHPALRIVALGRSPVGALYGADQLASDYLQKPFPMERLLAVVRRRLEEKMRHRVS